jgi:hypothetical protein
MEMENVNGLMDVFIWETGIWTKFKVLEFLLILIGLSTQGNSTKI